MHRRAALLRLGLLPALPWALSACGGSSQAAPLGVNATRLAQAIARLHDLVPLWLQRTGVPGAAVAVVYQGKVCHAAGYGLRRIDAPERVDADTVFQLASLSKPIGATVMAAHMGGNMGKQTGLTWDTPIQQLLPDFSLAYADTSLNARLSLGDLYAHRSGLPDHVGDTLEDLGYTRSEILQRLRFAALHPYGQYDYTNFGLTAAAQAMSQAQGQDWADLCASSLYQAIGMQRSSSRFCDFAAQPNRAWGHIQKDVDYASYGASPATYLVQEPPRQPDAQSPAGGVSSCANDLARWMALVLAGGRWQGQQIIDASALQAALSARPGGNYGYGFNIGTDPYGHASISHSGAFILGAATAFILWPQAQLGIAVLTNAQPRGLAEALALSFGEYAWGEVPASGQGKDWLATMQGKMHDLYRPQGQLAGQAAPNNPIPAQNLQTYVGSYANDYWGAAQIALQPSGSGQALELRLGATPVPYLLQHWDGETFTFTPQGESFAPNSISALHFSAGQMQIELLKEDLAQGVFHRV